ncbi:MAG: serine/threonine protein kinase bacterial [bacterium]|nr:MAG: serine/threonine protein kinase bacterial [bacterium]
MGSKGNRDLKPNNIFLINDAVVDPFVKVLDFGIAFLQGNSDETDREGDLERLTDPNIIVGTPEYMSPEQIRKRDVNKETDIYSLGIIFYEILSGQVPFLGSEVDILISHINVEPTHISNKISIDTRLANLIMQMLAKDAQSRPQLEEIITTLEHYLV